LHGDWTGGAFHCFKLAKEAGTDQPFYALEPFVFEEGPEIPTIESMAASYLKIVRSVQPEGPYYLGGYCNGGLIAYEMALQLKNAGEEIDLLALVDPSWGEPAKMYMRLFGGVLHLKERQQWKLYLELRHIYIRKMRPIIQKIKHSVDQQLLDGIQLLLDRDETFKRLHPSTQTLRKDYSTIFAWALQQYEPDYYDGKVIHYWARDEKKSELIDPWMNKIQMKETVSHIIPGTHYTILTDEIQTFAERLGTDIKEAQERKR
jgi:thioesterase domain-containing protein